MGIWEESKHPRDRGKFASVAGSGGAGAAVARGVAAKGLARKAAREAVGRAVAGKRGSHILHMEGNDDLATLKKAVADVAHHDRYFSGLAPEDRLFVSTDGRRKPYPFYMDGRGEFQPMAMDKRIGKWVPSHTLAHDPEVVAAATVHYKDFGKTLPPSLYPTAAAPATAVDAPASPSDPAPAALPAHSPSPIRARNRHDVQAIQKVVANDRNRKVVADGFEDKTDPATGNLIRGLTVDAQNALRSHHNKVLASYGLSLQDESRENGWKVEAGSFSTMGRSRGMYNSQDGHISLTLRGISQIADHAKIDGTALPALGHDMMKALDDPSSPEGKRARSLIESYHISTHESIHDHGPTLENHWSKTMLEEMTTEMAARKIVSDMHDFPIDRIPNPGYQRIIEPVIDELRAVASRAGVAGVTERDAHEALADASLHFKRQTSKNMDPSFELYRVGQLALERLGVDRNMEANKLLHNNLLSIAQAF